MGDKPTNTQTVRYTGRTARRLSGPEQSISVIGIDTEALDSGRCFMVALSTGEIMKPTDIWSLFATRKLRGAHLVAYNLRYDSGALLQQLPIELLDQLRTTNKTRYNDWSIRYIPHKLLSFSRKGHSVRIWDMFTFYLSSLDKAAEQYLGEHKLHVATKRFTPDYVSEHFDEIARYCLHDAELVQRLAERIIAQFEEFGIKVRALYSTAFVSYQHFRAKCVYPTVRRFWDNDRKVLDYAMAAYQGGKFEVTEKGLDYYYEYDIVSAYPYEIANLLDISNARVVYSNKYRKGAAYGFVSVSGTIPVTIFSPCIKVRGSVNTYPVGPISRVITIPEYDYLLRHGADITIMDGAYLYVESHSRIFRRAIATILRRKELYRQAGDQLGYHTAKILMNSLYGKMVQLIKQGDYWKAGQSWNPIYGAYITAAVRVRVSELQQTYRSVVAVHTDSVISTKPLPFGKSRELGELSYETEGNGIILGSGIYQIGEKRALRGFGKGIDLFAYLDTDARRVPIPNIHALSWREAAFRNLEPERINRFEDAPKFLDVAFDTKRIWLHDYAKFADIPKRKVKSVALPNVAALFA